MKVFWQQILIEKKEVGTYQKNISYKKLLKFNNIDSTYIPLFLKERKN